MVRSNYVVSQEHMIRSHFDLDVYSMWKYLKYKVGQKWTVFSFPDNLQRNYSDICIQSVL